MKKINCVIVDDEVVAREILESYVAKVTNLNLLKSCKNALQAIEISNSNKVDLFFLDINMPEISGLSLAKLLQNNAKIIFTTAHREYAVEGFDLQAVDYLLKPIAFERFLQAINTFFKGNLTVNKVKKDVSTKEKNYFFVRSERKMIKINFDEIMYVESLSDYIKIHLSNKTILTRETISNLEVKLPLAYFLRIHRSFIVNLSKVDSYTNEFVEIKKQALTISRTYKENVLKKLESF